MNPTDCSNRIAEEAGRLLTEGTVDVVIGFEKGSLPMRSTPCFVRTPQDSGKLVWNSFCSSNLSRYLKQFPGKVGIVAKGCDTRALVELIKEKQLNRESLVVIGVPCRGMIDGAGVLERCDGKRVSDVEERDDELVITGDSFRITLAREEFLHPACRVCFTGNPVLFDVLIGEKVQEQARDCYHDVSDFGSRSPGDRWAYIMSEMDRCIRCYACRNACPLCYCGECFVDATQPQWVGRGATGTDTLAFHVMRSMHLAGRCVECGACRAACPTKVDIRTLNRKISSDIARLFDYRPGLRIDQPAPLSSFKPDDSEEFILER